VSRVATRTEGTNRGARRLGQYREQVAPVPNEPGQGNERPESSVLRRLAGWLAHQVAGATIGVLVGAALVAWILAPDHPSFAEQLDHELQTASNHGFNVTVNRAMDLHGTGVNSRLIVLEPRETGLPTSDEVRIYEEDDGDLRLRYSARPVAAEDTPGYRFRILGIGRYDASDREEIIGTLDQRFADGRPPHPVAVVWNVRRQRYEMLALLTRSPQIPRIHAGVWGATARDRYRRSEDVRLSSASTLHNLRGAETVRARRGVLVAGYIASSECNACGGTWMFVPWALDFQHKYLSGFQCALGRRQYRRARVNAPDDIERAERRTLDDARCPTA
jgi:hypothetical protein